MHYNTLKAFILLKYQTTYHHTDSYQKKIKYSTEAEKQCGRMLLQFEKKSNNNNNKRKGNTHREKKVFFWFYFAYLFFLVLVFSRLYLSEDGRRVKGEEKKYNIYKYKQYNEKYTAVIILYIYVCLVYFVGCIQESIMIRMERFGEIDFLLCDLTLWWKMHVCVYIEAVVVVVQWWQKCNLRKLVSNHILYHVFSYGQHAYLCGALLQRNYTCYFNIFSTLLVRFWLLLFYFLYNQEFKLSTCVSFRYVVWCYVTSTLIFLDERNQAEKKCPFS